MFGIFEGGGAKGIAHIGAIKAAEENGLVFIGVAGASAGAIVAALIASGHRADDIMRQDGPNANILYKYNLDLVNVLGRKRWTRLLSLSRHPRRYMSLAAIAFAILAILAYVALARLSPSWTVLAILAPCAVAYLVLGSVCGPILRRRGYFRTSNLKRHINRAIYDRAVEAYTRRGLRDRLPKAVRFRDLDPRLFDEFCSLKIVVTNLSSQELVLFDRVHTPDAEIADAVIASIALPGIFEPVSMTSHAGGPYVDGALVSNLPSWVFTEEKIEYERTDPTKPPVPVIGFTVYDQRTLAAGIAQEEHIVAFVRRLLRSSIFGSQAVVQEFVDDFILIKIPTEVGVLGLGASWMPIYDTYRSGYISTYEQLQTVFVRRRQGAEEELRRICKIVQDRANDRRRRSSQAPIEQCRMNVVQRVKARSFRVTYAFNMDLDADDRLLLDGRADGAPRAFEERAPVFLTGLRSRRPDFMTKYEVARVRRTLDSALCIPIFADVSALLDPVGIRPEPVAVACFDSDENLGQEYHDPDFMRMLVQEVSVLAGIVLDDPPVKGDVNAA